jgi:hypothetical protein
MTFIPDMNLAFLGDLCFSESFPLVLTESGSNVEILLLKSGWSLQRIQEEDVLQKYDKLGQYLPFITKDSWIE